MFYCDPCANKNGWHHTMFKSRGQCELCGDMAVCNDTPSSLLPNRPTEPRPTLPAHVEPSTALALTLVELQTLDVRLEGIQEERVRFAAILEDGADVYFDEESLREAQLNVSSVRGVKCCTAARFRWSEQRGSYLIFRTTCTHDGDTGEMKVPLAWMNEYLTRPTNRTA